MRNIEIKARIKNICDFLQVASNVSDQPVKILNQTDTYFNVSTGRLKLREIQNESAMLIQYDRPDVEGPKLSTYYKQEFKSSEEVKGLKEILTSSLGIKGIVSKQRHLFMVENTRIHVDDVKDLGHFMELEVILREEDAIEHGQQIADNLMSRLGVSHNDLISESYINMIKK